MQLVLPIFPEGSNLISFNCGYVKKDNTVTYFVSGLPVWNHEETDHRYFKLVICSLLEQKLCTQSEIVSAFSVTTNFVYNIYKRFKQKGPEAFYGAELRHGKAHKLVGVTIDKMQKLIDLGESNYAIAKKFKVSEGSIRYALKIGKLKKKVATSEAQEEQGVVSLTPAARNEIDMAAPMGIAATNVSQRAACATGAGGHISSQFINSESVDHGGLLCFLPALIEQGLYSSNKFFALPSNHYYGIDTIITFLAFMALARVKNPEQVKQHKPGDFGKLMGIDRVPEVSCLRKKIKIISQQNKSKQWNYELIDTWEKNQPSQLLYIDGHVRIYNGQKANLTKKFVSRQKLCLAATTEFWVNDANAMPVLCSIGELSEKLQDAILNDIIPQLQQTSILSQPIDKAINKPRLTLVFDREAFDITFFKKLWNEYRISIITYRKNVKDSWDESEFKEYDSQLVGNKTTMLLCDKKITLSDMEFTEVRRLGSNKHQTSIIYNDPDLAADKAAIQMFGRWGQENYFKYLIEDYDFDKMIQYGTEALSDELKVVNPHHRRLTHQLKKTKEKLQRNNAQIFNYNEKYKEIDPKTQKKQDILLAKNEELKKKIEELKKEKENIPYKIKLADMDPDKKFNKLKTESKAFMNIWLCSMKYSKYCLNLPNEE
jgi:hypothetical protein